MIRPRAMRSAAVLVIVVLVLGVPGALTARVSTGNPHAPLLGNPYAAQELNEVDEVLWVFEENQGATGQAMAEEPTNKTSSLRLSGSGALGGSYNFAHEAPKPGETDFRGLSRLRPLAQLNVDLVVSENWKAYIGGRAFYDLAYLINGRDNYTEQVLDNHEKEAEFGEVYVQGSLFPPLDLKAGRQIVVWGTSDHIRVVDILNPLDLREPGLVDIEDLRLPVTMTKLDCFFGPWNLSGIVVHEIRWNKEPASGNDFYPFDSPPPPQEEPHEGFGDTEFGVALKGIFTGWDISLFAASFFDDQPHLEAAGLYTLKYVHSRLTMLGASADVARGSWLFKGEAAFFDGLEFFNLPGRTRSRLDLLVGLEYSGFTETTITLEAANRHLFDFDPRMEHDPDRAEENDVQGVLRFTRQFRNDTIELTLLASVFGLKGENGALERVSMKYDLSDCWSITGGVVWYQSGDKTMFSHIGDNDRFFFEVRYRF